MRGPIAKLLGLFLMLSLAYGFDGAKNGIARADEAGEGKDKFKAGDFLVRLRAAYIVYEGGADNIAVNTPFGPANFRGSVVEAKNSVIPEADLSYFITKNLAIETICCAAYIKADASGALAQALPSLGLTNGTSVGNVWALPLTLMFQYHFDSYKGLKPYVGVGPTYAVFVNEKVGTALQPFATSLSAKNQWGYTLQAGLDTHLGGNWFANLDAKYMHLEVDATWQTPLGPIEARDVRLNPWILSVGLGYRF